jgi:hypothetical protein
MLEENVDVVPIYVPLEPFPELDSQFKDELYS